MDYDEHDIQRGLFNRDQVWDVNVDELLEQARSSKRERLEQELDRIKEQLDGRDTIHEDIVDELEFKVEVYLDNLRSLYKTSWGKPDEKRLRLKNRIEKFQTLLRRELREHWQDIQKLEQERRDVLRELKELDEDYLSEFL